MVDKKRVFLVLNPGSSSEKFSLYEGETEVRSLYFEGASEMFEQAKEIFEQEGLISVERPLDGIIVRVVAAGRYFAKSRIVDEQTLTELARARMTNPLHVQGAELGIRGAMRAWPGVPVIMVSDSEALMQETRRDMEYALPGEVLAEFDLARWGAHGVSYGYMMNKIAELGLLTEKMVVCHLGSGCSMLGMVNGRPVYTSMGETPLEGLMSSTRAGSVDPTIGALLGEKLGAEEAIKLMNEKSGLLALAGESDMKEIIAKTENGEMEAKKAYDLFVDGVVGKIGELAAKMGGIDALVFTATIGERSEIVRTSVVEKLKFLGFEIREGAKIETGEDFANVAAEGSRPIYVIPTNEAAYMIKRAGELLDAF